MSGLDYKVISADSHVIEPHDLWQRYVPARYKGRAPRHVEEVGGFERRHDGSFSLGVVRRHD